jgi:DNA topoisomerase-1
LAKEGLTETALKLYGLIWQRFLASQMAEAIFDSTKVELKAKNYIFEAKGQTLKFDGFLKIYPLSFEESKLPPLAKDESLELNKLLPSQHFTQSPPRYSEASLVKALEKWGVGRPSTYAPILETIQARGYVQKDEKKFFLPTEIGLLVNDLLVTHFPEVVDVNFTAKMEVQLDQISEGKKTWLPVVRDFWTPFSQNLKTKEKEVSKKEVLAKLSQETVNEPCPECAAPLVVKFSRFGKFYACSRFPDCKYKKNSHRSLKILCPKCREGEIVERMTRKRKRFYGCSGWPRCDFALWDKPTGQTCPQCQSLMVKKWGREKCSHKDCSTVKK